MNASVAIGAPTLLLGGERSLTVANRAAPHLAHVVPQRFVDDPD